MSESDQTWNAGGDAPGENWPQYTWAEATSETPAEPTSETPAAPAAESVSWPPTQPTPVENPYAAPGPYVAPGPYAAPGPYTAGPYAPGPYGWPPVAAAPAPAPVAPTKARRGLAALAALALVVASAGVGAGVAIAVHNNDDTRTFSSSDGSGRTNNTLPSGGFTIPGGLNPNSGGSNGSTNNGAGTGTLDMNAIADKVDPALVNINTTLEQGGRAAGSGMLISSSGEIVTNNHVIAGSKEISVVIGGVGASHPAKVLGYDVSHDVALLQITDDVSDLPTISFGDPSKVQIGDPVVALGNALGAGGTPKASQGHVTALDQQVTAGDEQGSQETLEEMIQINAPIKPGDSGGALVDADGKVIGMNTAAASGGGQFNSQGSSIGFAIPIDNAVDIVRQIQDGKESDSVHVGERAMLGVNVEDADNSSGALVEGVQDGTGAADAGIKNGDVIIAINGKSITDSAALRLPLSHMHPGDSVSVGWLDSSNTRHDASIKLVAGPPL